MTLRPINNLSHRLCQIPHGLILIIFTTPPFDDLKINNTNFYRMRAFAGIQRCHASFKKLFLGFRCCDTDLLYINNGLQ